MATTRLQPKSRRFHYAWVVLASAMALGGLQAIVRQSFGVFIDPLVEAHGWSRGEVSLAYSAAFVSAVAVSLGLRPLLERTLGVRRMLLLGIAGITIGLILTGTATTLWQLYLFYGLFFGGMGFLLNIVMPVAITRWFGKGVGVALGFMWASLGIGGVVGPVAFRWLITNLGWQRTFFLAGSTLGATMLLALYFFRSRPQDKGLTAYGEEPAPSPAEAVGTPASPPSAHVADFGVIRRLPVFWYLVNIHFMGCVGHSILLAHIVPIATFRGLPGLTAAGVLSTITGFSIFSRFGTPMLAERIGGKKTLTLAFLLQALPVLLLFGAHEAWQFYLFAAIFGLGFGAEMPSYPIVNRQYWGTSSPLTSIYSWQIAGAMSGMALGGWLGGVLFDMTGAYTWAIAVSFLFSATGLVPIMALPRHRPGVILAPSPAAEVGTSLAAAQLPDPE